MTPPPFDNPVTQLTGKNFDAEVLQNQSLPVLVLWGAWMDVNTTKIRLSMMTKLDPAKVKNTQVYADDCPDLVMKFSVRQIPLVVLFVQGMAVAQDTSISPAILQYIQ